MKSLKLRIPPPLVMSIIAVIMFAIAYFLPVFHWLPPYQLSISIFTGSIGLIISSIGVLHFKSAHTTIDPRKPSTTSTLVTTGIYRYSRNPMYLGTLLLLVAWSFYLANILSFFFAFTFIPYINKYQIIPEERFLKEKFGHSFTTYQQQVRRWI